MNVEQIIAELQKLPAKDEVIISLAGGETGCQLEYVTVRRVYDNDAKSGDRRVVVIMLKPYGEDEYEFIEAST